LTHRQLVIRLAPMNRGATGLLLVGLISACRPTTDLIVGPPPRAKATAAKIDVPAPRSDGRLPDGVRPRRYRLALDVDPAASVFRGEVRIELDIDRAVQALVLHGSRLEIEQVEISSDDKRSEGKASFRKAAGAGDAPAEELVIESANPIAAGDAELRIVYRAPLDDKLRGLYRADSGGKSYAFTQLEPTDARRMLPCFDDPGFKTPFEVSVTVPRGNRVFSNAHLSRERDAGEDATGAQRVRFDFAPTEPIPSYLLALAIGPLEVLEGPREPVPLRFIAPEGKADKGAAVVAMTAEMIDLFVARLGRRFPYPKLDLVAVPSFGPGAMENAGLITFREELVLLDGQSSALARRRAAQVVAHELAHQWFGDSVTLRWWDDLWLNEGFANYYEAQLTDAWRPEMRAELEDFAWLGRVMDLDALDAARRVRQPVQTSYQAEEAFDAITYSKGAAIIGMVRHFVGDEAFRNGIKSYLGRYAGGHAGADDLFRALGDAAQRDVAGVAGSFVDQPGVPLVTVGVSCQGARGRIELAQRRYRSAPRAPEAALWKVPVCIRYGAELPAAAASGALAESESRCVLMDQRESAIDVDECPAWVLPNDDYRGYYRYALAADKLSALWRATSKMDARAKVGFLSNAWALVQAGELPTASFMAMLAELRGEREREVVLAMIDAIDRVAGALVSADARGAFEKWAAGLLLPTAKNLGWAGKASDSEDTKLLRQAVLEALAVHTSDPWLYGEASQRAAAYLRDPDSADADTITIALRAAAHSGKLSFEALRSAAVTTNPERRIRALRALGSFADPKLVLKSLDLALEGVVKPSDVIYMVRAAAQWQSSRDALFSWLEAHLAELAAKSDGMSATLLLHPLARVCDAEQKARLEKVFTALVKKIGGSERRVAESLQAADACVDLRRRQSEAASKELSIDMSMFLPALLHDTARRTIGR
jgi:aminopeptidase N